MALQILLCALSLSVAAHSQEQVIVVGADNNFPPFEFADKNGQPAGYTVDLIHAVASEMGIHIRVVTGPWSELRRQFDQGNIDVLSGMFFSPNRTATIDFSIPHSAVTYSIFVRNNGPRLRSVNDLRGRTVLAQQGDIASEMLLAQGIHLIPVADPQAALHLLSKGEGDAAIVAKIVGLYSLQEQGIRNVQAVSNSFPQQSYCFAVRRNRKDALLSRLNEGLTILKYNGVQERIAGKWLGPWEQTTQWRRYLFIIGAPLATLLALALAWSWTLRRLVREQTASLQIELAERQRAERELQEANRTLETTLSASPVAIIVCDLEERVKVWNKTCEVLFGWTANEVVNRPIPTVPVDMKDEDQELLRRTRQGESITNLELKRRRKDGKLLELSASIVPLRDDHGRVTGTLGVYVDYTERKGLEAQLLQAQKMESVGRMAGGVAHDFNNLLGVILGHGELLTREISSDSPWHERVEQIVAAGQRASALTAQLLAFSRRQILQPQVVNLNTLLSDTNNMLSRMIREDIALQLRLDAGVRNVKADPGQLVQVILNLAVNARDAMPAGGTLSIATSNVDFPADHSDQGTVVPAGRYVVLTVKDTGVGMDAETRASIFEPFFTTKPPEMGTGLGLAMVHGIVSQSGGYISVESELGAGTNFNIYFPQLQSEEVNPEITPRHLPKQIETGSETLLLVEDAMALRTMIGENLRSLGYTVLTAANGVEALELAREYQEPIHLLITDVVMPLMGGVELQKEMLALRPGIPVLFMTGYADETLEQRQNSARVVLIQKPFRMDELAYTLREIFTGTRNASTDTA